MEKRKIRGYDEAYMEEKIRRATPHWRGIDSEEYIDFVRRGVGEPKWVRLPSKHDTDAYNGMASK